MSRYPNIAAEPSQVFNVLFEGGEAAKLFEENQVLLRKYFAALNPTEQVRYLGQIYDNSKRISQLLDEFERAILTAGTKILLES